VVLVLQTENGAQHVPMDGDAEGYRSVFVPGALAGHQYGYLLDGEGPYPDPCSRRQPNGVHGLSSIVDPSAFAWHDDEFEPPPFRDLVIYECHIGTVTPGGTFDAAIGILPGLRDLGINAIEVMPVASFPGRWNWGYDGVSLFAPAEVYGGPDGFRRFINAAHQAGIAVILDVVHNHFGPDGNYTAMFSDSYTTNRYDTPWGQAINFDGPDSAHTRRFFRENLLHWAYEYHLDGFRMDATHAIFDSSPTHILAELSRAIAGSAWSARRPYFIAESHENDIRYLAPLDQGGFGFDAVWADDFHHAVRTAISDEDEGYFQGYSGSLEDLARTICQGFLYEGQFDPGIGASRGTSARHLPWNSFVYCIQNHDQVGNRPFGQRLNTVTAHGDFLAASLLLLLLPQVPVVFQGQEYLSNRPFLFFTDHKGELAQAVSEGRRHEFGAFRAFSDPEVFATIPDPQAETSFRRSVCDSDESTWGIGLLARWLYRAALELRNTDAVVAEYRRARLPIVPSCHQRCLLLTFEAAGQKRWLAVNLGTTTTVQLDSAGVPTVLLHTNEGRFGGNGIRPVFSGGLLTVPAHAAVFLSD